MYINPIGNRQNINHRAKFSLLAEKNLLPKNAAKQFTEKAKTIGNPSDEISVALSKMRGFYGKGETMITLFYSKNGTDFFSNTEGTIVRGSHKERQQYSFNYINDYLDNLKKIF